MSPCNICILSAIQEPLCCLYSHSLAFGSRLRARKYIYESLSVLGYASPLSNSMRGMFFCFPLFCPFAATRGVLGRSDACRKPFIIRRLSRKQMEPSRPKPSRLSVGKSVGKQGESPRVRSLFPTSHLCVLRVRLGSENGATHRCYPSVLPCFPASQCPLVDSVCVPWTSPLISPASY